MSSLGGKLIDKIKEITADTLVVAASFVLMPLLALIALVACVIGVIDGFDPHK